jgi:hypothetical protein
MHYILGRLIAAAAGICETTGPAAKGATYTRTETALAFIIFELSGERAEALFIAMAAWVPTAGEHSDRSTP